ncbi:MAG TPA: FadR/GntR family transcriptional regulator [Chloroflexia bacterium]|nr:FadR/GntR family transcriptional regulator [Chloroflexia bacterium]
MASSLKKLERPEPFYRAVQESIKSYITENNLLPGSALPPENELARQLGVSRNSVREAAKALESVGILETRHGSGLFVREFSFDPLLENLPYGMYSDLRQLEDLLQVRRVLELGMIDMAIESISAAQLAEMEKQLDQMRQRAEKEEAFPEEDRAFHRKIYEATGNSVLLKLLDVFWLAFHNAALEAVVHNTSPKQTYLDHAAILKAIKAKDVAQVRKAIDKHYGALEERIKASKAKKTGL